MTYRPLEVTEKAILNRHIKHEYTLSIKILRPIYILLLIVGLVVIVYDVIKSNSIFSGCILLFAGCIFYASYLTAVKKYEEFQDGILGIAECICKEKKILHKRTGADHHFEKVYKIFLEDCNDTEKLWSNCDVLDYTNIRLNDTCLLIKYPDGDLKCVHPNYFTN